MSNYQDRDADKIKQRRWTEIRREWMNYVPERDSPWPVPEHEVSELPTVDDCIRNFVGNEIQDVTIDNEIGGLRAAVIHESVIWIH